MAPEGARVLVSNGHNVIVERNAGQGSGFSDEDYKKQGAKIVSAGQAWKSDLVVKVKEPLKNEYKFLNEKSILFTFLHLAGVEKALTLSLLKNKTTSIAYETVEDMNGKLPLLAPMSAVAGNMSVTMGSYYLAKFAKGKGMQLGSVMGNKYGKIIIIGDGVVGTHAAHTAYGMGADVYVFTHDLARTERLKDVIGNDVNIELSNKENIAKHVKDADLVVGAVLLRGAKAPYVVTEEMVKAMQPGSVIVDVSIDQGGCIETSKPTSHSNPVYLKHGIIHYCVTNMPAAYPRTSTLALTNATLPYILKIANEGFLNSIKNDQGFAKGINTYKGYLTYKKVAEDLNLKNKFMDLNNLL